jgi:membrane protease YdiL (CAAX protease family)
MTAATLGAVRAGPASATSIRIAAVTVGLGVLVARPAIATTVGWSPPSVAVVFATVLALGLVVPTTGAGAGRIGGRSQMAGVLAAGTLVFLSGRLLAPGHAPTSATASLVALNTLAAVSEEALFRRLAYETLLFAGPVVAVGGSALLFGLAHVTVYGWWAFPLDVAAGVVLGWQRWASGGWGVPAATHALADLLVLI